MCNFFCPMCSDTNVIQRLIPECFCKKQISLVCRNCFEFARVSDYKRYIYEHEGILNAVMENIARNHMDKIKKLSLTIR